MHKLSTLKSFANPKGALQKIQKGLEPSATFGRLCRQIYAPAAKPLAPACNAQHALRPHYVSAQQAKSIGRKKADA
jgi:hypothetical protein